MLEQMSKFLIKSDNPSVHAHARAYKRFCLRGGTHYKIISPIFGLILLF